jgi:hypothetical protein
MPCSADKAEKSRSAFKISCDVAGDCLTEITLHEKKVINIINITVNKRVFISILFKMNAKINLTSLNQLARFYYFGRTNNS